MLDFADVVAINKFERRGGEDARRDVARQLVRNREAFGVPWEEMPVFGTSAARFDDDGVTALYQHLKGLAGRAWAARRVAACCARYRARVSSGSTERGAESPGALPVRRQQRRAAATTQQTGKLAEAARRASTCARRRDLLATGAHDRASARRAVADGPSAQLDPDSPRASRSGRHGSANTPVTSSATRSAASRSPPRCAARRCPEAPSRGSHSPVRRMMASSCASCAARTCLASFPYTAGVFPFKRSGEPPGADVRR